jgi:GTP-binding protein EngB required for normal cell division
LRQLLETGTRLQLEQPAEILEILDRLGRTAYRMLLAGQTGSGRQSMINALIGREILPIEGNGSEERAMVVKNSQLDDCRIRFEDGSSRQFSVDEVAHTLPVNQSDTADAKSPGAGRTVRWIELDVPARFLPEDLEIVYLPALPQAREQREAVIRRFTPLTDAVIFVLDSCRPIDRAESNFIAEILAQTPDIFFIQTKIDQYPEEWEQVLRRNQEILKAQFNDRLTRATIWPISSKRLLLAASAEDAGALRRSRFESMERGLREFLAVLDVKLCTEAIRAATAFHRAGLADLHERADSTAGNDEPAQPQSGQLADAWDQLGRQISATSELVEQQASRMGQGAGSPAGALAAPG